MTNKREVWQERITPKLFEYCVSEIGNYKNAKEYADAVIRAPIWNDEMVFTNGRKELLVSVWDAYHRSLSEIVNYTGMSKAAFYRYFGIPRRTFQDWIYGVNVPPVYTLFMIQEILGLVTRY